jgi:hypothetical protein
MPASAAPLQPIDKWGIDYGATQCTAARAYGNAASPTLLGIVPSLSGSTYVVVVSEPLAGPNFAQEAAGTLDFGTGTIRTDALYFGSRGVNTRVQQFRISAAEMEKARAASAISLRGVNNAQFEFALSNVSEVIDALRRCTADLQRSWNLAGSTQIRPIGDVRGLFTTNDLPKDALQRQEDKAQYQLLVDEKGAVAGCDVLVPSGSAVLDSVGCQQIRGRAKFKAAKDANGKPVRGVWTSPQVTWRSTYEAFDNGCRTLSAGGGDVNSCGQTPMQGMPADQRSMIMSGPTMPPSPSGGGSTPPH